MSRLASNVLSKHCEASRCLSIAESREPLALADCLKRFARQRLEAAVRASPTTPIVLTHMLHCWGASCDSTSKASAMQGTLGDHPHWQVSPRTHAAGVEAPHWSRGALLRPRRRPRRSQQEPWDVFLGACRFMKSFREACAHPSTSWTALFTRLSARKSATRHVLQE